MKSSPLHILFFVNVSMDPDPPTDMTVMRTSHSTGFMDFRVNKSIPYGTYLEITHSLYAPVDSIILISVMDYGCECPNGLEIYAIGHNRQDALLLKGCYTRHANPYILEANNIILKWRRSRHSCSDIPLCTKIYFSYHSKPKELLRLSSGLYNCTAENYWKLQQHLDCNLEVECEDGLDETEHCSFSSPACRGWMAVRDKCYKYVSKQTFDRAEKAGRFYPANTDAFCASLNATKATIRNGQSLRTINKIFMERLLMKLLRGLHISLGLSYRIRSVPSMYRRSLVASDKTVIHHSLNAHGIYFSEMICFGGQFYNGRPAGTVSRPCVPKKLPEDAMCEYSVQKEDQRSKQITFNSKISFSPRNETVSLTRCPSGELIHMFLSLYPHNACGEQFSHLFTFFKHFENNGTSVFVFTCSDGVTRLSYTLVCDFWHHCKDGSDETFCQHPSCDAFACSNGQCVSYSKRCDLVSDCLDDSDEQSCEDYRNQKVHTMETRSPVLINFNGIHSFTGREMGSFETCPETHYRCPGEYNDCLPVYTRCNGWYDCMDLEDEQACGNLTCPGFYHCFNSSVCAHADHLCDGWPHCAQGDDEWLCDMICPTQCLCQGHVFLCSKPFPVHLFTHLRYLDAQGTDMTPTDLANNSYIVHLSLSGCSLTSLPPMSLVNLQFLDLSANNLTIVSMTAFIHLHNLKSLSLARNPIDMVHHDPDPVVQMSALHALDLSHSKLRVFDSKSLSNLIFLNKLDLSFSEIHTVHPNGFRYTPKLTHLYLSGIPLTTFSPDLFKHLTSLRFLSTQTYKLCCTDLLPHHFDMIACNAPRDEISSCKDLLRSDAYRGFLWLISFLSLLGNVFCLVVRVCVQKNSTFSGFHVFVSNLSIADLLMGVYIVIVGVADSLFRGEYLFYDEMWKHSVACKVAGFLSLLSCEVSALTIWLITLDRFIVLHFPFSGVRFQKSSAAAACLFTWIVGLLLSLVPLLPVTSHWQFYSQTGICIPLPVTRQDFDGKTFSFCVFVVFNFIMFMLIATGQAFIYWSVQKNTLNKDHSTNVSRDLTIARRLISVAVTDFLCWFPIGLCGLIALWGIPVPGEVNVALAIFVLPLNSALNPFMYTFNMLMEKRRKARECMLLQWLESRPHLL